MENPTHQEIRDVLVAAGLKVFAIVTFYKCQIFMDNFQVGVENKLYSREKSKELLYRGRIRVQLKNDDNSLCNPNFPTRDSLMLHLGDMIPKLKSRLNKGSGDPQPQVTGSAKGKGKGKGRR